MKWWVWALIGFVVLSGGVAVAILPRGIRNNNPGNIRDNNQAKAEWLGEIEGGPNDDPAFLVFESPVHGIRALAKLLRGYQSKYKLRNVADIIAKYAPSTENNTTAYVNAVAKALGVDPRQDINVDQHMPTLVKAIIKHENGQQPYADQVIQQGIGLA